MVIMEGKETPPICSPVGVQVMARNLPIKVDFNKTTHALSVKIQGVVLAVLTNKIRGRDEGLGLPDLAR